MTCPNGISRENLIFIKLQNELQKNYIEFTKRMAPIVGIRKNKCSEAHSLKAVHAAAVAAELGPVTAV